MSEWDGHVSDARRSAPPRHVREILELAMERMSGSDEARAYRAWMRASGAMVASTTAPRRFAAGVLTVACPSSVWTNELTYLGAQILTRMNELAPGHPVRRLRFVVSPLPALGQSEERVECTPHPTVAHRLPSAALNGAHGAAAGIRDERLRSAVQATLRAAAGEP